MPSTIPSVNSPWRAGDRELVRSYAGWPISNHNLTQLTSIMNRAADTSSETVVKIQSWMDEAEDLEQDWADKIADGTAHLGNVQSYEGPIPGVTLTAQDRRKKLDVIEWDTDLLKVKYTSGNRADSTSGGVITTRIEMLRGRVLQTLGIEAYGSSGVMRLARS
jgi:hypothetical protein